MAEGKQAVIRPLVWLGDSRRNIQGFPSGSQKLISDELQLAYETNAYRAVYAVQLGKKVYVLHAFQKKSKSGIKTTQKDVDLIKRRYNEAKELAKREEK